MKPMNVILMLLLAVIGISAMAQARVRRGYSETQGERSGLYNAEYDGMADALPPRRVRFYRTGGTILLG